MFASRRGEAVLGSRRSMVLGRGGMVCTSQPLASFAGVEMLRGGGNAVDAAICAAAVLGVVEPFSTGVGGDCFMPIWHAGECRLYGLNGGGRAPRGASVDALGARESLASALLSESSHDGAYRKRVSTWHAFDSTGGDWKSCRCHRQR